MENENKKDESTQIETPQKEEVSNNVDYDRIDKRIDVKVETEIGKFIKTFIENNGYSKPETETINIETETTEERELKEWRI